MPAALPQLGLQDALLMETGEEPSQLDKIVEMILDPRNIGHLTDLTRNEINAFSKARAMCLARPVAMKAGKRLLDEILILLVSKSRKGRAEMIKIVGRSLALQEQSQQAQQRPGFFGRRKG